MANIFNKGIQKIRQEGVVSFLRSFTSWLWNNGIRPKLPAKRRLEYNGVEVDIEEKYLDELIPFVNKPEERPHFESGLINGLGTHVSQGDTIVTLGGGWGVTAVKAAELTGDNGLVYVYEGASDSVEKVRDTARRNDVNGRIVVKQAIVGPKVDLMHGGDDSGAVQMDPSDLPECDILEMDIEGSEIEVLNQLSQTDLRPRIILVESHGWKGAPSDEICTIMERMDYEMIEKKKADLDRERMCEERDIYIISGSYKGSQSTE